MPVGGTGVVIIRNHGEADFVAEGHRSVGVEEVRMIGAFEFLDFAQPLLLPAGVLAVPAFVVAFGGEVVEIPVVRIRPVIRHTRKRTGLVGVMAVLEPGKAGAEMFGHTEAQAVGLGGFLPGGHHIAVRSVVHGIPGMQLGFPKEEIVMVRAHAHEILRAGLFVEFHQSLGIPVLGFPKGNDVLPAVGGGMTETREVVVIIGGALLVHLARIPVAHHRHGLRSPVGPNAELGIAKPLGVGVVGERIHGGLERPGRDRQAVRSNGIGPDVCDSQQTQAEDADYFHGWLDGWVGGKIKTHFGRRIRPCRCEHGGRGNGDS